MGLPNSARSWDIRLDAWIIQDGNYPDFEAGQTVEFAVDFWPPADAAIRPSDQEVSATSREDHLYDAVAEVVLRTDEVTILDIGFMVYSEASCLAQPFPSGPRIAARPGLGVDPFVYFECLGKRPGIPPLVYTWKIQSILRQTSPLTEKISGQTRTFVRDPLRLGYEEIRKTDAWEDDQEIAEYVLRCDLLSIPPMRMTKTAL